MRTAIIFLLIGSTLIGCTRGKYTDICYDKHHNVISCIQEYNDKQLNDHGFGGGV